MPTLLEIQHLCHQASKDAGWWNDVSPFYPIDIWHKLKTYIIATKIALIHSEVSEALEAFRKGGFDLHLPYREKLEVELADAVIRTLDLAGFLEFDLEKTILEKLEYNRNRPDHKLENRVASGGKTF